MSSWLASLAAAGRPLWRRRSIRESSSASPSQGQCPSGRPRSIQTLSPTYPRCVRCTRPSYSGERPAHGAHLTRPAQHGAHLTRPALFCGQVAADFEQRAVRPFYQTCSFVCLYMLAALEAGRSQAQVLHEADPCCYQVHSCPIPLIGHQALELSAPSFS